MSKRKSVICPCSDTEYIPVDYYRPSNSGTCLIVPVTVHNVCKGRHLLVIVEVYKNNNFYARELKEVFTGSKECNNYKYDSCNHNSCNYSNCNHGSYNHGCCDDLIDSLFIDNFEFYFLEETNPSCIYVEVKTQYIYD